MIKAERLKELIEKKATIYQICYGDVIKRELRKECVLKENNYITCTCKKCIEAFGEKGNDCLFIFDNNCFETKAEAEHNAKYGNIEKTVKMPVPPTWEKFLSDDCYGSFSCDGINIYHFKTNDTIRLCLDVETKSRMILQNTEENYYKALDKMVELWREEV